MIAVLDKLFFGFSSFLTRNMDRTGPDSVRPTFFLPLGLSVALATLILVLLGGVGEVLSFGLTLDNDAGLSLRRVLWTFGPDAAVSLALEEGEDSPTVLTVNGFFDVDLVGVGGGLRFLAGVGDSARLVAAGLAILDTTCAGNASVILASSNWLASSLAAPVVPAACSGSTLKTASSDVANLKSGVDFLGCFASPAGLTSLRTAVGSECFLCSGEDSLLSGISDAAANAPLETDGTSCPGFREFYRAPTRKQIT